MSFVNVRIEAKTGMEISRHRRRVHRGLDGDFRSGAAVTIYDADVTGIATVAY